MNCQACDKKDRELRSLNEKLQDVVYERDTAIQHRRGDGLDSTQRFEFVRKLCRLTPCEVLLLAYLYDQTAVNSKDRVFAHLQFHGSQARGRDGDLNEIKIVDVYVCKLRQKLRAGGLCGEVVTGFKGADKSGIETVWGRGYQLSDALRLKLKTIIDGRAPDETCETVATWADETFGPVTDLRLIERAGDEFNELIDAVNNGESEDRVTDEMADVMICLMRRRGIREAINRKMKINRSRKWRMIGDGTGYHMKETV